MKPFFLLLMIVLSIVSSFGQAKSSEQIFDKIDLPQKKELIITLKSFIKSYESQDWEKLYDIFPSNKVEDITKKEFVQRSKNYKPDAPEKNFIDFIPVRIDQVYKDGDSDGVDIIGCGTWKSEGKELKQKAFVSAYRINNKWFIWGVFYETPMHGGTIDCPIS